MRIATYNIEWFNSLFDEDNRLIYNTGWSARHNVTRIQQADAIATVFAAMDADAIMIIEAPDDNRRRSTVQALQGFAEAYGLRTRAALIGYANDTQQEIALLYDPLVLTARHDPQETDEAPRFDRAFRFDLDTDAAPDLVRWSKPPLEVALTTPAGQGLRLIGVHAKSKAPYGARNDAEAMRIAIENRRKQLAQCIWLRHRVEQHLAQGDRLIVLGDFNDGPGLDEYEQLFGRSGVEIVLGEGDGARLYDPNARAVPSGQVPGPTTARFWLGPDQDTMSALLDYIMVSPEVLDLTPSWRIWHPDDDPLCASDADLRAALLTASDHFPVTVDLDL